MFTGAATIYWEQSENTSARINLLIISVVWILMIVLTNPLGDYPLNDDWVYALAVESVLETGYYQFPSASSANVGPQIYWGALFCLPFGFSFTALRFSTLTLGLMGVWALHGLIRYYAEDNKTALLGALTLAVNPLYFGLANSFMTDVPFIAVVLIAMYFLVRGLQHDSRYDIALGLVITFLAILVRQLGLVVLLAFAVAYLVKRGFTFPRLAKVSALVVLGGLLHIAYQYWLISTGRTPLLTGHAVIQNLSPPSILLAIKKLIVALTYIGFFVLPFIAAFSLSKPSGMRDDRLKNIGRVLAVLGVLLLGLLWWSGRMMPLSENVLISSGLGPLTLRDTFNLGLNFPTVPPILSILWGVITIFSVAAACAVIYYVGVGTQQIFGKFRKAESRSGTWPYWQIAVMAASYFFILLIVAARFPLFDRYLLLFIPLIILLIVTVKYENPPLVRGASAKLAWVLIFFYAVFSVAATHDYLAWNRTRWAATNDLMQQDKVSPKQIDGGYEFNGWFLYDAKYKHNPKKSWWWVVDDEYVIASGPIHGYAEMRRYTFNRWLLWRPSNIFVLRKSSSS